MRNSLESFIIVGKQKLVSQPDRQSWDCTEWLRKEGPLIYGNGSECSYRPTSCSRGARCEEASEKLKGKDYSTLVLLQAQLSALTHRQNAEHVPSLMKHF